MDHAAAVALYTLHYNFARTHRSLVNPYPRTPAMAAGIEDHIWSCEDIAALLGDLYPHRPSGNNGRE